MKMDKNLREYSFYATATGIMIYLGIAMIQHIDDILKIISEILGLLSPLIIALVIAYLLKPGVQRIEKTLEWSKLVNNAAYRRTLGIVLMYLFVITAFFAVIYGIYVMTGGKLSNNTNIANMSAYLTEYLKSSSLSANAIREKLEALNIPVYANLNQKIAEIVSLVQGYFSVLLSKTVKALTDFLSNIPYFIIAIVLSIYLLKDAEYFLNVWRKIFRLVFGNGKGAAKADEIFHTIDDTFKKYIRGQFLDAFIVAVLSTIVLYFIGIDYALMIGLISGICNMIPYVGPVAGTILAVIMALLSGQPILALWAILGMLLVQQVDNNLVAPKIIGDSLGLHPLFTMLAILIGGDVGGLFGMLTAVPIFASAKILFSKWYNENIDKI